MINTYKSIIAYDEGDDFFDEYLTKIGLIEIFKPLLEVFTEKEVFKKVVLFILYAYHLDSEMLYTGGDAWIKLAPKIFDKVGLEDKYLDDVCYLENATVRSTANKLLEWQNSEHFTNYCHFRDLRMQMLRSSTGTILKNTGEQDFEQKMKNATHSIELLKMMEDAKQKYIQTNPKLRVSIAELNKVTHQKATKSTEEIFTNG